MNEDINQALRTHRDARLPAGHADDYPPPPATQAELDALEAAYGQPLHDDVVTWFLNGNVPAGTRISFNGDWMLGSINSAINWWRAYENEPDIADLLATVRPHIQILTDNDIYLVVDGRADTPSAVYLFDVIADDDILEPFAPTLLDAITQLTASIAPPLQSG